MKGPENVLVRLAPGDVVDVVAPSSACSPERLERGLVVLREWGLEPHVPPDLFGPSYIYANDDSIRLKQLRAAIDRPRSRAIWCVRGGYGSGRLLPRLARFKFRNLKPFFGFSDLTALHLFFNQAWGQATWHCPVLSQLGGDELDDSVLEELRACVFGEITTLRHTHLISLNSRAGVPGTVEGRIVGGNLKTLQSMLGTPFSLSAHGRIVVLEDVQERAYAVDRMLLQLRQTGALKGASAVVFGSFTRGLEANGRSFHDEVLARFAASTSVPVFAGLQFGHGEHDRPIPLGLNCRLDCGSNPSLTINWNSAR